jgi:long-chain acyl-CoA synthetase
MMVEVSSPSPTVTPTRPSGDSPSTGTYGRVAAWLSKRVEIALAEVDLTLPQYRVLGILAEGTAAASGLADRVSVRRPSITAIIDGLVARGFVERVHDDSDRRRIDLHLTNEGIEVIEAANRKVDEHLESIATCLNDKDETMALRSLELWGQALQSFHQARADEAADTEAPSR